MDPVSQGSLGAALSASRSQQRRLAAAALVGALAGMAPDLDVLIRSSTDPLLFLTYHRQFTHALAFIPVGAGVCAVLLYPFLGRSLSFKALYGFSLLGYATHGLLDACTSYGTQLLWPFSEARIAWNDVAVVDPLFTLPLLGLTAAAVGRGRPALARLAFLWAMLYLGLGAAQGWRAERAAAALAEARGHEPDRLMAKPSFANLLVWKTVYSAAGWYYVDAVRLGAHVSYYPGDRVRKLRLERDLPWLAPDSRQAEDVERFREFSSDWLAPARGREHGVVDVRYSLIPNEVDPLWGIRLDPRHQQRHARFFTDRATTSEDRERLWEMISAPGAPLQTAVPGKPPDAPHGREPEDQWLPEDARADVDR